MQGAMVRWGFSFPPWVHEYPHMKPQIHWNFTREKGATGAYHVIINEHYSVVCVINPEPHLPTAGVFWEAPEGLV